MVGPLVEELFYGFPYLYVIQVLKYRFISSINKTTEHSGPVYLTLSVPALDFLYQKEQKNILNRDSMMEINLVVYRVTTTKFSL